MRKMSIIAAVVMALTLMTASAALAEKPAGPTCFDRFDDGLIATHGQHIIGDYVTGVGHDNLSWPPKGQVGVEVGDGEGVAVRGGPGPGFHFTIDGLAPGASFCTGRAAFNTPDHFQP